MARSTIATVVLCVSSLVAPRLSSGQSETSGAVPSSVEPVSTAVRDDDNTALEIPTADLIEREHTDDQVEFHQTNQTQASDLPDQAQAQDDSQGNSSLLAWIAAIATASLAIYKKVLSQVTVSISRSIINFSKYLFPWTKNLIGKSPELNDSVSLVFVDVNGSVDKRVFKFRPIPFDLPKVNDLFLGQDQEALAHFKKAYKKSTRDVPIPTMHLEKTKEQNDTPLSIQGLDAINHTLWECVSNTFHKDRRAFLREGNENNPKYLIVPYCNTPDNSSGNRTLELLLIEVESFLSLSQNKSDGDSVDPRQRALLKANEFYRGERTANNQKAVFAEVEVAIS